MATRVTYNGVTMHNITTRSWSDEVEYDSSGTDVIGSKHILRFEGALHLQPSGSTYTESPTYISLPGRPANIEFARDEIERRLTEARGDLVVTIAGIVVFSATGSAPITGQRFDVNNGPKPRHVDVMRIVGSQILQIQFEIEATLIRCSGGPPSGYVVNNRWSIEEVIDKDHFTQRTIRGRIRFTASRSKATGFAAGGHGFKALVVPPLEDGFRRDTLHFVVLPNGLEADYTVVDQQIHTSAPWPATTMSITETRATQNGLTWISDIAVRLSGPPDIPKIALLVRAFQIADGRLRLVKKISTDINKSSGDRAVLESAMFIDHIGEQNTAEFRATIKEIPELLSHFFDSIRTSDLGKPLQPTWPTFGGPKYEPGVSLAPRLYGSVPHKGTRDPAVLFLFHCYLQDPCDNTHAIAGAGTGRAASPTVPKKNIQSTSVSGQISEHLQTYTASQFSDDHRNFPYIMCRMESTYRTKHSRAHCPIAKTFGGLNSKSPTAKTLTLALPLAFREIVLDMERLNERPQIVKPEDTYSDTYSGITGTLLDHEVTPLPPTPTADGRNLIFRTIARYKYGLDRPPTMEETVAVGVLPFTTLKGKDTNFKGKESYKVRVQD
jgi:hypothetical protein